MIDTKRWLMTTEQTRNQQSIKLAAAMLAQGKTVAFPTETVYGLGADATNEIAVSAIFKAKGRPQDNPLIAHVATKGQLQKLVTSYPTYVDKLLETFSPGPITYILPSNGTCATNVTANLDTIGVRIPNHKTALALLKEIDLPIAAPSANVSGKPSPTTANHVWEDLQGKINGLLDAGPTGVGVESTIIDCTQDIPVILRPGGVTKEQLESVIDEVKIDSGLMKTSEQPKAPGMKYRHYSPEVPLYLVEGSKDAMNKAIAENHALGNRVGILASSHLAKDMKEQEVIDLGKTMDEIATHLYDALRYFKKGHVDVILCESLDYRGMGEAVMNRLTKAASGDFSYDNDN